MWEMLVIDENMRDECEKVLVTYEKVLVPMSIYRERHVIMPILEINVEPFQLATTFKIYMLASSQLATS